ncbi:phosphodiester glycosidase family protein [Chryseobacterium arthrosphaerae]|uniref:Phosphodiester glycosidase family protein n=1 Tax=Chryseobacterium arthrosphaerae TaxID=651561 RepID=A0ABU7QX65_9FLAO|nr:phosphodiester glycosidase family protein [Chryseobacterium arthrosphaerae]
MKSTVYFFLPLLLFFTLSSCKQEIKNEDRFVICQVNPEKESIRLYWKNKDHKILGSIARLKDEVESGHEELLFSMNGGMFEPDHTPKGLYIENFKILKPVDSLSGSGNFYLPPNGVLYITRNHKAGIVTTQQYRQNSLIRYATQSGPMLLMDGKINPLFQKDSKNLNIRNGVGILENGELIFAMSKKEISFYTFARLFKELGCRNALYLDGYVSRAYLPEKNWVQKDGDFGVIIGVTRAQQSLDK